MIFDRFGQRLANLKLNQSSTPSLRFFFFGKNISCGFVMFWVSSSLFYWFSSIEFLFFVLLGFFSLFVLLIPSVELKSYRLDFHVAFFFHIRFELESERLDFCHLSQPFKARNASLLECFQNMPTKKIVTNNNATLQINPHLNASYTKKMDAPDTKKMDEKTNRKLFLKINK